MSSTFRGSWCRKGFETNSSAVRGCLTLNEAAEMVLDDVASRFTTFVGNRLLYDFFKAILALRWGPTPSHLQRCMIQQKSGFVR